MVMAEGLTVDSREQANDEAGDAASTSASAPLWGGYDHALEALSKLPDGWQENPAEALASLITNDERLALPMAALMAQAFIENGDQQTALELLDSMIGEMEANGRSPAAIRRDTGVELLAFQDAFEATLYARQSGADRPSIPAPEGLFGVYMTHGCLLFEAGLYERAEQSLKVATALNPVNPEPLYELAEIAKLRGDWDGFLALTERAHGVAYTSPQIARYYRNRAFRKTEMADYTLAGALLWHSLKYDAESDMAWNELKYLRALTGKPLREPSVDEIKDLLAANGIPPGPSVAVIEAATALGRDALANGRHEDALLASTILCDVARA